jgi:hypothetical protein
VSTRTAKSDPLKPSRADYRFLKKILESSSIEVVHIPAEYDLVLAVFKKAGGDWERLFDGSSGDIHLLKKIAKVAYKHEYLTHAPVWE